MRGLALVFVATVVAVPVWAQDGARTGVSRPDETVIAASPEDGRVNDGGVVLPAVKPSAAVPVASGAPVYGAYVPYAGAKGAAVAAPARAMTEEEADGAVVLSVPERAGYLRVGTLLQTRLKERLSTTVTEEGTPFSAEVVTPVEKDGRVVLPVGSVVEGVVTRVHGGRRISGAAEIHLEARSVVLPDGTRYVGHLQLIDTDQTTHTKVDSEGSLVRKDHPKEMLAAMGVATGGAAAAGAVIGGGVGAAVGAGIGAGASTIVWLKHDRQEVVPDHALLVFSLSEPMALRPEVAQAGRVRSRAVSGDPDGMVVGEQ